MKWGLLAYGRIARKMEESLLSSDSEQIVAISSASQYKSLPNYCASYASYHDLLADPEVEIVYISTTHNHHAQWTIEALNAGKHVLCEKPFAVTPLEVDSMITAARKNNRFLMEAIWSRYLPGYQKAIGLVKSGVIGEIEMIQAHFCFKMNPDEPKERLIDPNLAAGAIWDVGIYPISLVTDLINEELIHMDIIGQKSDLNVENRCAWHYQFENGTMAQLSCAVDMHGLNNAVITGTKGMMVMNDFWKCERFQVHKNGELEDYYMPFQSTGLYHEAIGCSDLIRSGMIESQIITWRDSQRLAKMMADLIDTIRQ